MTIPRPEYPRPQFVRRDWLCLNGEWEFEIDASDSGLERGLLARRLAGAIQVPFCPESQLSGVACKDYMDAVWYRREVTIPAEWAGREVLLHFQAVDYDATVWVNGVEVFRHRGGFTPFTCDLRGVVAPGETATIVVRARDPHGVPQPRGKQAHEFAGSGALYGRTTGIWQSVWMEPVPASRIERPRITPHLGRGCFIVEVPLVRPRKGMHLRAVLTDAQGAVVSRATCPLGRDMAAVVELLVPEAQRVLWEPGKPYLYGLELSLLDGQGNVVDEATSYAGLRSVAIDGKTIKINGKAVFQRLVLDQGYYPESIMTAPNDEALRRDIELSMAAGFNGARLHQKVFEERFLYWADQLGYMVWGEFGDWGCGGFGPEHDHQQPTPSYITQWLEALARDYSHPSIVGWCPLNETWQPLTDRLSRLDEVTLGMYLATKAMDLTRPVLDASGYSHRVYGADVYDCHDYEQDPARFAANHAGLAEGKPFMNGRPPRGRWETPRPWSIPYAGQPFFVSEFGGIWWNPQAEHGRDSWGYGERCRTVEEVYARFEGLCNVLLGDPNMFGYCYTQLTDIDQEQNGVLYFDRTPKLDLERLRRVQQQPAAIELADQG
ncbi:MAG: sugar-binding domain-containing protein [Anaerolineales bacterium]